MFKPLYPKFLYLDIQCYRQEYLVSKFLNVQYPAHDALANVDSLRQLVSRTSISVQNLAAHSELLTSSIDLYKFNK